MFNFIWIAIFLAILGTFFISSKERKPRLIGFIIRIIASISWIIYGYFFQENWAIIIQFLFIGIFNVRGMLNNLYKG